DLYAEVPAYRAELARCYFNLATESCSLGRRDDEVTSYEKSRDLRAALVEAHPKNLDFRSDLGRSLNNLGLTLGRLGRVEDSRRPGRGALRRERGVLDGAPHGRESRRSLNNHYGALAEVERKKGSPAAARKALLERRGLWPGNGVELYRVARELALTAEAVGRDRPELSE